MSAPTMVFIAFVIICIYLIPTYIIFKTVYSVQPTSYMDEIFHIPQVQNYCNGSFSKWDNMITTLPGLYIFSVGLLKPISMLYQASMSEICSVFTLRAINLLISVANVYLLYCLTRRLAYGKLNHKQATLQSIIMGTFPVLYFCTFLYYTDSGATFFILLAYLFCLHDSHILAAMMGLFAVCFRQTNIIWVFFMAGLTVGRLIIDCVRLDKKHIDVETAGDWTVLKQSVTVIGTWLIKSRRQFLIFIWDVLTHVWSYLCVLVIFVLFIIWNGSIVVGDKSHHQACFNGPQLFYFLTFTAIFSISHSLNFSTIYSIVRFSFKRMYVLLLFAFIAFVFIKYFTYVHDFLLADNRHYPFYIWSRLYRYHEYVRFYLIPVYYASCCLVVYQLKHKDIFWKLVFTLCVVPATVPQKLLEFRYFIIPYLIYRVNIQPQSTSRLLLELLLYSAINAATLYLFIYRPFKWPNSDDVQRFMW